MDAFWFSLEKAMSPLKFFPWSSAVEYHRRTGVGWNFANSPFHSCVIGCQAFEKEWG